MTGAPRNLPYRTPNLPGIGGVLRTYPADFRVEEIPAYPASGTGDHVFVTIEKTGLTTPEAATRFARALDIRSADIGWAGMKDRHAVTRQTLSLPPPITVEQVETLEIPGISILAVTRHRHKLKTGHLRGNRFCLTIRDLDLPADAAAARASAILDILASPPGAPNWYASQRFGRDGKNPDIGRDLITGAATGKNAPRGRARRLFISAFQSQLFNDYLQARMDDGVFDRVVDGDILQKCESGGVFHCTEPDVDQSRMDTGEVVVTGPIFGHNVRMPPQGTLSATRESAILALHQIAIGDFARAGKLASGTRRPIAVRPGAPVVKPVDDRSRSDSGPSDSGPSDSGQSAVIDGQSAAVEISFELPAGSYATAILREIVKGPTAFPE